MPIVLAGQPLDEEEQVYFTEKIKPLIDGDNVIYIGRLTTSKSVLC